MDSDLEDLSREALIAEVTRLRAGIRAHRDGSGHELCWHHPRSLGSFAGEDCAGDRRSSLAQVSARVRAIPGSSRSGAAERAGCERRERVATPNAKNT